MCCVLSSLDTSSKNKPSSTWYLSSANWLCLTMSPFLWTMQSFILSVWLNQLRLSLQILGELGHLFTMCWGSLSHPLSLLSNHVIFFNEMFVNKSLTFQHLHLEGGTAWVVIIWLWKAHSLFKSYVLSMFTRDPLGMIQSCWNKEEFLYWLSGLWIRS